MKKINELLSAIISFIKKAGSVTWEFSVNVILIVMAIAAGVIILTIPFFGWYFSLIASVVISASQHQINRLLLIAILLLYGPIIMLAGVLTFWWDLVVIAIIQGAICWVIFLGFFLLTWYLGYFKPRQKPAQSPQ
ncbi:MAG: hypothetical protein WC668_01545 [Patescibacteria group bacterium]|jgi:hypothetical protein